MDRTELEIVRGALNAAFQNSALEDLQEAYRDLTPNARDSKLTVALRGALEIVEFHLIEGGEIYEDTENGGDDDGDGSAESVEDAESDSAQPNADAGTGSGTSATEADGGSGGALGDIRETESSSGERSDGSSGR